MTQEEHLNRIVARCRELLSVAERRTPGRWVMTGRDAKDCRQYVRIRGTSLGRKYKIADLPFFITGGGVSDLTEAERDACFVASCAGPAEAGWRATIAAIEAYFYIIKNIRPCNEAGPWLFESMSEIIAAWPEELL